MAVSLTKTALAVPPQVETATPSGKLNEAEMPTGESAKPAAPLPPMVEMELLLVKSTRMRWLYVSAITRKASSGVKDKAVG